MRIIKDYFKAPEAAFCVTKHRLTYRFIEVQHKVEEETVAPLKLEAHRRQSTHKVNELHHRVLEPR